MPEEDSATLRLIRCQWGGWLAVSPTGQSLQIGVTAPTKDEAREKFSHSLTRWMKILTAENRMAT